MTGISILTRSASEGVIKRVAAAGLFRKPRQVKSHCDARTIEDSVDSSRVTRPVLRTRPGHPNISTQSLISGYDVP